MMTEDEARKNEHWLKDQLARCEREVARWPQWMRDALRTPIASEGTEP